MELLISEIKAILTSLLPAFFGVGLSIFTDKKQTEKLIKFCTFLFGVAVAYYIGYGFIEWAGVKPDSRSAAAIVFTVGYVGLNALNIFIAHLPQILTAIRVKFLGS